MLKEIGKQCPWKAWKQTELKGDKKKENEKWNLLKNEYKAEAHKRWESEKERRAKAKADKQHQARQKAARQGAKVRSKIAGLQKEIRQLQKTQLMKKQLMKKPACRIIKAMKAKQ